ncbi:MAG: hypothetical protein K2L38_07140, partial [Dysosmobacter sp.]|nr:hypothetical protein [Dysosmobacter sp.]
CIIDSVDGMSFGKEFEKVRKASNFNGLRLDGSRQAKQEKHKKTARNDNHIPLFQGECRPAPHSPFFHAQPAEKGGHPCTAQKLLSRQHHPRGKP